MRLTASLTSLIVAWSLTVGGGEKQPAPSDSGKLSLVLETKGHTGPVVKVLFTPSNKETITVSEDKTIRFWDTETGEHLRVLRLPTGGVNDGVPHAAALSPDGKWLAVGGRGPIYLIGLLDGKLERILAPKGVSALDFSPDGTRLGAINDDGVVRIWSLANAQPPIVLNPAKKAPKEGKGVLAFSPDGQKLVVWIGTGRNIWDLKTEKKIGALTATGDGRFGTPRWVDWHPEGKLFATTANDGMGGGSLRFWKPDGLEEGSISEVWSAAFLPNGQILMLTTGKGRELRLVDPLTRMVVKTLKTDVGKTFQRVDVAADGKLAALSGLAPFGVTHDVQLVQLPDGALGPHLGPTYVDRGSAPTGFNRQGTAVARPFQFAKSFHFFDLQTLEPGSLLKTPEEIQGPVLKRAGATLEVEIVKGVQHLKIVKDGAAVDIELPVNMKMKEGYARYTFVGNDYAAAGAANGELMLFHASTGKLVRRIKAHRGLVTSVAPSPNGRFVVSRGDDHLLCVWNITQDQPLLYLYGPSRFLGPKLENEWVVWTPQGYYAASQGGETLIGWQVDNGPDQLGGFYTIDRFRKTFHRPDVISRLLRFGTLEKALDAADKERGIKTREVLIGDALPPQVAVTHPAAGTTVKVAKVAVQAKAISQGKFPVTEVQLLLDGRPVAGGLHKVAQPKLGEIVLPPWNIELPPGNHELSVVARSAVSSNQSAAIQVAFAPAAALKSALYVLAIGINDYPAGWKLNCAEKDAKSIEAVFLAQKLRTFSDVQTKLLTKDATKENIEKGFAWLHGKMLPQDVAVIFYAGHSMNKKGTCYLLPLDTNFAKVEETAIEDEWIKKRLTEMPGRILVMFDACHNVAPGLRIDPPRIDGLARDLSHEDCGVVVMCATTAREPSGVSKDLGHGYFAYAVIQGLLGKADKSKDGQVYLHHLDTFVYDRVVEMSGDAQHPVVGRPTSVRTFALAKPK